MNAKRGILRLWLAISVVWIAFMISETNTICLLGLDIRGDHPWCKDSLVYPYRVWSEIILSILGFPVLTGMAIVATIWIVNGFKK